MENRYHLSTLMCAVHRREVLKKINSHLKNDEVCRLVSTQLIEAGVDIDFPVGFRALAGLDSIIQAAGRVNRENKNDKGMLFVFEPDSPCIKRIPAYIQQGADVARKILRDFAEDPTSLDAVHAYFKELYDLHDPTISFDRENIIGCFEKPGVMDAEFDFRTAAEKFHLIDNATKSIIVPYSDKVYELLDEVKISLKPRKFLRDLQPYTVNIFEQEFNALQNLGKIDVYNDTVFVLNDFKHFYSDQTGLIVPDDNSETAILL
jgi:CRISPR-associated endonuclease/helicase Cas3